LIRGVVAEILFECVLVFCNKTQRHTHTHAQTHTHTHTHTHQVGKLFPGPKYNTHTHTHTHTPNAHLASLLVDAWALSRYLLSLQEGEKEREKRER
jgi:hypothetical protein